MPPWTADAIRDSTAAIVEGLGYQRNVTQSLFSRFADWGIAQLLRVLDVLPNVKLGPWLLIGLAILPIVLVVIRSVVNLRAEREFRVSAPGTVRGTTRTDPSREAERLAAAGAYLEAAQQLCAAPPGGELATGRDHAPPFEDDWRLRTRDEAPRVPAARAFQGFRHATTAWCTTFSPAPLRTSPHSAPRPSRRSAGSWPRDHAGNTEITVVDATATRAAVGAGAHDAQRPVCPIAARPRSGDPRLTTTSAGPLGAKLLYDLAGRLGWETQRRLVPSFDTDHRTIHAVLNPVVPLRVGETHALLNHVRAGGGALVVLGPTTRALQDSLRLRIAERGGQMQWIESDSARCRGRELRQRSRCGSAPRPRC